MRGMEKGVVSLSHLFMVSLSKLGKTDKVSLFTTSLFSLLRGAKLFLLLSFPTVFFTPLIKMKDLGSSFNSHYPSLEETQSLSESQTRFLQEETGLHEP